MTAEGYKNAKPIGTGGFATVYEARQVKFNRQVALKVLNLGAEGTVDREAFHNECVTMGALSTHPNIVTIFDSGFTGDGLPYISMELCDGTLLDRIKQQKVVSPVEVAEIGAAVAKALSRAHSDGIVHADIKPQNIFFTEYGAPALGDFGIASVASTRFGQGVAGVSLHYAAPELFNGDDPSVVSDLYALGATLYTALAGRRPFAQHEADGRDETMARVMNSPPPPITEQQVPSQLNDLVRRLMEKDPIHRPRSASSVAASLSRIAADLAATAKTASRSNENSSDVTIRRDPGVSSASPPVEANPSLAPTPAPFEGALPGPGDDDPTVMHRSSTFVEPEEPQTEDSKSTPIFVGLIAAIIVLAVAVGFLVRAGDGAADDPRLVTPSDDESAPLEVEPNVIPAFRLEAPEGLEVQVEGSTAIFMWSAVEGAEGYIVENEVLEFLEETMETELTVELDPSWPPFCPQISAFAGNDLGPRTIPTASDCAVAETAG